MSSQVLWLPNVAQKYFERDHVHGNGAENFDRMLCYDILSSNVIVSETDMFAGFKMMQVCHEIYGLSLLMDYECGGCCCHFCHFQTEVCTNTRECSGNNLEIILKFVSYKYDDHRISSSLPYNIRAV